MLFEIAIDEIEKVQENNFYVIQEVEGGLVLLHACNEK